MLLMVEQTIGNVKCPPFPVSGTGSPLWLQFVTLSLNCLIVNERCGFVIRDDPQALFSHCFRSIVDISLLSNFAQHWRIMC